MRTPLPLLVLCVMAAAACAGPKTAPVVTLTEFNGIQNGMTYDQVAGVIGAQGTVVSENNLAGFHTIMYMWQNKDGSNMNAMFQNGGLMQKSQFGLK